MHKKHQSGDNSKSNKATALILYATHRHDLFYITVKYHDHIPKGIQVVFFFFFFFFFGGGGGGGGRWRVEVVTGGMNMTVAIFCTYDALSLPLLQNRIVS